MEVNKRGEPVGYQFSLWGLHTDSSVTEHVWPWARLSELPELYSWGSGPWVTWGESRLSYSEPRSHLVSRMGQACLVADPFLRLLAGEARHLGFSSHWLTWAKGQPSEFPYVEWESSGEEAVCFCSRGLAFSSRCLISALLDELPKLGGR